MESNPQGTRYTLATNGTGWVEHPGLFAGKEPCWWYRRGETHLVLRCQVRGLPGSSHQQQNFIETTVFEVLEAGPNQLRLLPSEDPAGFAYDPILWIR